MTVPAVKPIRSRLTTCSFAIGVADSFAIAHSQSFAIARPVRSEAQIGTARSFAPEARTRNLATAHSQPRPPTPDPTHDRKRETPL